MRVVGIGGGAWLKGLRESGSVLLHVHWCWSHSRFCSSCNDCWRISWDGRGCCSPQTGDTRDFMPSCFRACVASTTICSKVADWQLLDPLPGPSPPAAALLSSLSLGCVLCRWQLCCQVLILEGWRVVCHSAAASRCNVRHHAGLHPRILHSSIGPYLPPVDRASDTLICVRCNFWFHFWFWFWFWLGSWFGI